jgi:hypothetical protein
MESLHCSKDFVTCLTTTRFHIPEDYNHKFQYSGNFETENKLNINYSMTFALTATINYIKILHIISDMNKQPTPHNAFTHFIQSYTKMFFLQQDVYPLTAKLY